jgi:probable F420-dependent oxidoreductase
MTVRFALQASGATTGPEWLRLAEQVDASPFDVLSLPDHLGPQLSPLPALAAAAALTRRVRLGQFVLANDLRNPGLLARDLATVDSISGGRLEVGLGAGWSAAEYAELGVPMDPPAVRIARVGEAVEILRAAFTGERFSHEGRFYQLRDFALDIPLGQPSIPLALGGGGPRMLELAARVADIVSVTTDNRRRTAAGQLGRQYAADVVREQLALVARAAGGRRIEINARVLEVEVTDDRPAALRAIGARIDADGPTLDGSPFVLVGTTTQIIDQIQAQAETWGLRYLTFGQRHLRAVEPIVDQIRRDGGARGGDEDG